MRSPFIQCDAMRIPGGLPGRGRSTRWWLDVATAAVAGLLSLGVALLVLDVAHSDLRVPFDYINPFPRVGCSDIYSTLQSVQAIHEAGWSGQSPRVAFPDGQDTRDWPSADLLHHGALWLLTKASGSYGFTVNCYYLLGFGLAGATAAGTARALGYSIAGSISIAILYACLPYHFMHGESHLFLSAYFVVPYAVLVAIWLAEAKRLVVSGRLTSAGLYAVFVGWLTGLAGVYYAAFAVLLMLGGSGLAWFSKPGRRSLDAVVPLLSISAGLATCGVPFVFHRMTAGPNPLAVIRPGRHIEEFALKLVQMIIPVPGHRVPAFAQIAAQYAESSPCVNENQAAALGFVGTAGLLTLLAWSVGFRYAFPRRARLPVLAMLNLLALLYAVHGGFGVLPALAATPLLRSSSRIVVYVSFLCLLAVVAYIEAARYSLCKRFGRLAWPVAMVCFTLAGLWDQVSPAFRPRHSAIRARFVEDALFGDALEKALRHGSAVFQLPFISYPEADFGDYQHFRPVLHTKTLRFSYGAMRGRRADLLNRELAKRLTSRAGSSLDDLREAGYTAVLIDRALWYDSNFERWLTDAVGIAPVQSMNERYAVFFLSAAVRGECAP